MTDRDREALEWLELHATRPDGLPWSKAATHALTLARIGAGLEPARWMIEWRWPGGDWMEGSVLPMREDIAVNLDAMRANGLEARARPLYVAPLEGGEHP